MQFSNPCLFAHKEKSGNNLGKNQLVTITFLFRAFSQASLSDCNVTNYVSFVIKIFFDESLA